MLFENSFQAVPTEHGKESEQPISENMNVKEGVLRAEGNTP